MVILVFMNSIRMTGWAEGFERAGKIIYLEGFLSTMW
jgi:hypothetical protein